MKRPVDVLAENLQAHLAPVADQVDARILAALQLSALSREGWTFIPSFQLSALCSVLDWIANASNPVKLKADHWRKVIAGWLPDERTELDD